MAEANIATEQIVRCPQCRYADGDHSIGCLHNEVLIDNGYTDNTILENSESSHSEDETDNKSSASEDSDEKREDNKDSSDSSDSSAEGSEASDNEQMLESSSNHFEEFDQTDDLAANEASSVNCVSTEVSDGRDSVNHSEYDREEDIIEFKTSVEEIENENCDNSVNQSDDEVGDEENFHQNGTLQPDSISFSGEYPDDSAELTEKDFNMFPDEHGIYKCTQEDCDYNTVVFRYFKRHIKKHTSNNLKCPFCEYTSSVKYHMNRHVSSHISSGSSGCPHCSFKSVRADMLRKHIKLHENANSLLACNQCSYTTHEFQRFETHLEMHKGRTVFACTECSYSTLRKGHYNRHMSRHTRKPLKCPLCSFTTTHRFQMQKHKENHKKQGEHIYFCNKCDYIAEKISRLKSHMLTHRSVCPVCSKAFSSDAIFKEHIVNHLKEFGGGTEMLNKQSNDDSGAHSDESETLDNKNVIQSLLQKILARKQKEEEEAKNEVESCSSDEEITKDEPKISEVESQHKPIAKLKINLKSLFASKSSISHKFDSEAEDEVESGNGLMGLKRSNSDDEEDSPSKKMKTAPLEVSYKSGYCTNGKIGVFNCLLCTFCTTTKKYLNRHLRRHDKSLCVVCPVCLITTTSIEMLLSHISIHSNESEEYECEECGNCSRNAEEFIHHMSQHNAVNSLSNANGKPVKSDTSSDKVEEQTDDKNALQEFLAKHTDFSVEPVNTNLEEEEEPVPQSVHEETSLPAEEILQRLELLKKLNLISGEQNGTLEEDSGYHPCTQCSYVALKKENLVKHVAQHAGKGMLYCPHCSYSTIRKEHMKRHVKLHTEGVLKCDQCEYETRRKEQFRMHLNSHLHEDHLKCPFCLYISIKRKDMKRHIARHTQEKVAKCPFCQYSSDRRERMKKHVFTCHSNLIENDNGLSWWRAQSEPINENTVDENAEETEQNGCHEEDMETDDTYDYAMNFVSTCMEEENRDESVSSEKVDSPPAAVVESTRCSDSEEEYGSDNESVSEKNSAAIKMAAIIQLVNAAAQSNEPEDTEDQSATDGEASERLIRAKAQQVLLDQHIKLIRYEIVKLLQEGASKEPYEIQQMLLNFQAMLRQTQVLYRLVEREIESCSKEIATHNIPAPPPLKSKSHVPRLPDSISCPLCDFSATWNDELISHIRAVHTPAVSLTPKPPPPPPVEKQKHPPTKKFMQCNSCKYTTFRSYHMRRHIGRKHAGKPLDDYHDLPGSEEGALKIAAVYSEAVEETANAEFGDCVPHMNALENDDDSLSFSVCDSPTPSSLFSAAVNPPSPGGALPVLTRMSSLLNGALESSPQNKYRCPYCSLVSKWKGAMKKHIKRHLLGGGVLKCKKSECDFSTNHETNMTRHMAKHEAEKYLYCGHCNYKTVRKHHLRRHSLTCKASIREMRPEEQKEPPTVPTEGGVEQQYSE